MEFSARARLSATALRRELSARNIELATAQRKECTYDKLTATCQVLFMPRGRQDMEILWMLLIAVFVPTQPGASAWTRLIPPAHEFRAQVIAAGRNWNARTVLTPC